MACDLCERMFSHHFWTTPSHSHGKTRSSARRPESGGLISNANEGATMVSGEYQSPNAIPPRRSSTGLGTGYVNLAQPVLKPVPESSWISQDQPKHSKRSFVSTPPPSSNTIDPSTPCSADSVAKHVQGVEWTADKERIVLGPFEYLYDHPGKDIRKQFIAAFNAWLKVPEESLAIITRVVGMLHTASLLYVHIDIGVWFTGRVTDYLFQRRRRRRLLCLAPRHPRRP